MAAVVDLDGVCGKYISRARSYCSVVSGKEIGGQDSSPGCTSHEDGKMPYLSAIKHAVIGLVCYIDEFRVL